MKENLDQIQEKIEKIQRKKRKGKNRKKNNPISGKSVFTLQEILKKKK